MPCDPAKVANLNAALDGYMRARQDQDFYDDEDEDEIINPLEAPKPYGDGTPEKIHGEPNGE